jgi:hypothetical protein
MKMLSPETVALGCKKPHNQPANPRVPLKNTSSAGFSHSIAPWQESDLFNFAHFWVIFSRPGSPPSRQTRFESKFVQVPPPYRIAL